MTYSMFKDLELGVKFFDPLSDEQFIKTGAHTGRMVTKRGLGGLECDACFDDNEPVEPVEPAESV